MAKKYRVYASGKDLAQVPMTQNENGKYYRNSSGTYFKPTLAEFDTAKLPSGYKTYIGGSHAKYVSNPNRNPLDFSIVAGSNLTMNVDVNVLGSTPSDGSWCKVQPVGSDIVIGLVHTYQWRSGTVKAGNIICKVAPQSVTGFAPHLHIDEWSNKGRKIRYLILNGDFTMSTFSSGDKIIFTDIQNIRKGSGTNYEVTGQSTKGMIATIEGSPREAGGYVWYDLVNNNWVADVGKFEKYTAPTPPPVDEDKEKIKQLESTILELNKRINTLTEEIKGLREALRASDAKNVDLTGKIEGLEGELGETKAELKGCEEKYGTLMIEKKTLVNTNMELVAELNELKEKVNTKWWDKLFEVLSKLFKKDNG
jgi:hypothetical protein